MENMKVALLIPIYQPSEKVIPFLSSIDPFSFEKIVIVDDGSGEKYASIFQDIEKLSNFIVISYPVNHGKGYALKTGFKYIKENYLDVEGIVTADGDGQHLIEDIFKVRDALISNPQNLILGIRDFSSPACPSRNRFGNKFSRGYFRLATGVSILDTQTGLRGIPKSLFDLSIYTRGDRYEYEFSFLNDAVKEVMVNQIVITTIYDNNESSHFRAIRDSLRIYKTPLLYLLVAITSFFIDFGLFALIEMFVKDGLPWEVLIPYISARLISGPYNFLMNNYLVFPTGEGFLRKLGRYVMVYLINMVFGLGLLFLFDYYLPKNFGLTLIKLIVETIIFIVNFIISKIFIYARKKVNKVKRKSK